MTFPRILASGDTALVIEFGTDVDRRLSERVLALDARVRAAALAGVVETVPTIRSLMVHYDPNVTEHAKLADALLPLAVASGETSAAMAGRRFRLPACYDPDLAPDLTDVAAATGLSVDAIVEIHAHVVHRVYMIGFLPGQPYMGDLPERLRLPRRQTPRTAVPQSAVAIATSMSTIYPIVCPGGWHLIARTPARIFDLRQPSPVLLGPGDEVTFAPISRAEYDRLAAAAADGTWTPAPIGGSAP